jgi:hypothetical protein
MATLFPGGRVHIQAASVAPLYQPFPLYIIPGRRGKMCRKNNNIYNQYRYARLAFLDEIGSLDLSNSSTMQSETIYKSTSRHNVIDQ